MRRVALISFRVEGSRNNFSHQKRTSSIDNIKQVVAFIINPLESSKSIIEFLGINKKNISLSSNAGSKSFWRTRQTIDIAIFEQYVPSGPQFPVKTHVVQIVAFDPSLNKEVVIGLLQLSPISFFLLLK